MTQQHPKRFILSGGGTGGHIFPAVAIAKELMNRFGSDTQLLFVGAIGKMEMTRIPDAGFQIVGLPVEGLQRSISPKNILVLFKALYSVIKARNILKTFKPDAVIGTGGYVSLPVCLVASRMNIPVILQEQNGFAGLTNKVVGPKAAMICTGFPDMDRFFPKGNWTFTGNPVRESIVDTGKSLQHSANKDQFVALAAEKWNLRTDLPIVFITGGSLGARTINETIQQHIELLLTQGIQIIWQTGERYWQNHQTTIKQTIQIIQEKGVVTPIYASAFIDSMDLAMAASTAIISRAGAITLSEISIVGTPAILIPSPNVTDDHQTANARVLSNHQAALFIADTHCKEELVPTLLALLKDSAQQLAMSQQLRLLAKPQATSNIVDIIEKFTQTTHS